MTPDDYGRGLESLASVAGRMPNRRHRPTPTACAWDDRGISLQYADGSSLHCYVPCAAEDHPACRESWQRSFRAEGVAA